MPAQLPNKTNVLWRARLSGKGLGGVAANDDYVIATGRDLADTTDIFRCYKAATGNAAWTVYHQAPGKLDFGSTPRATPLIHDGRVFLFGAFGHLQCVELATGVVVWEIEIKDAFPPTKAPTWGYCGSPLICDGKLIVSAGGIGATLLALDPNTGAVIWKGAGDATGYGSFVAAELGTKLQIVGHDATTLGGWEVATGKRLWTLTPPNPKDFNVPTPIVYKGQIIVATENNGTRLYRFHSDSTIDPTPAGHSRALHPDTHTPVVIGNRLFGVSAGRLHCLNLEDHLQPLWDNPDSMFANFTTLIAGPDRLLAIGMDSEILLIDAMADKFKPLSRMKLLDDESGVYAHPAIVGNRLYYRGGDVIVCIDIGS